MQIGTRWTVGQNPPSGLPQALLDAIALTEAEHTRLSSSTSLPQAWTLTWMERRPICTLDSGVVLTIDGSGEVHRSDSESYAETDSHLHEDNDDWLSS